MSWLRRSFITGFFVLVPLFISVAAFIWIFNVVDGLTTPFYDRLLGRRIPGLGTLATAAAIVVVGAVATNVIGKRLLQRVESYLLRVPVFRTIYAPVKQLLASFSPDNESGFKRVVMIEDARHGFALAPIDAPAVVVLAPPIDGPAGSVLALLEGGESWSTSALARALGSSQRTVQRTLRQLEEAAAVRAIGRGRSRRWLAPALGGFATTLLLPGALPIE